MTKKYTYLVHIALFLAAMILLCLGFFLESPNGTITEQRAMPTCKEVQEVAEETRPDAAAPQGVTREFHFTLDNNLTEKQLMFYVINSNTKVYINGELVFDKHRIETNKVSATGCYWVNLTLLRADNGKEVTVELQPLYAATVKRAVTFYEGSQYPAVLEDFETGCSFLLFRDISDFIRYYLYGHCVLLSCQNADPSESFVIGHGFRAGGVLENFRYLSDRMAGAGTCAVFFLFKQHRHTAAAIFRGHVHQYFCPTAQHHSEGNVRADDRQCCAGGDSGSAAPAADRGTARESQGMFVYRFWQKQFFLIVLGSSFIPGTETTCSASCLWLC